MNHAQKIYELLKYHRELYTREYHQESIKMASEVAGYKERRRLEKQEGGLGNMFDNDPSSKLLERVKKAEEKRDDLIKAIDWFVTEYMEKTDGQE